MYIITRPLGLASAFVPRYCKIEHNSLRWWCDTGVLLAKCDKANPELVRGPIPAFTLRFSYDTKDSKRVNDRRN